MKVAQLTRKFKYNGVDLADPNPGLAPEKVKDVYANMYPELVNSVIEGPTTKDGVVTYTFTRAVGTKGATALPARQLIELTLGGGGLDSDLALAVAAQSDSDATAAKLMAQVATSRTAGLPIPLPASAFGMWG